jgi:carbonic anhydrase
MMRVESGGKTAEELPFITGGGLTDRFNFFQLHFHWGKDTLRGSEHYINNRQYVDSH